MKFIVASMVPAENYRIDMPLNKQKGWREHADFMNALAESRTVLIGGPIGDSWVRMLVFPLENESEVRSVMSKDPWAADNMIGIARIEEWNVLLDRFSSGEATREEGFDCFLVRRKFGKNWNYSIPIRQQDGWSEHAAFMDSLVDEGTIILGGLIDGGPYVQVLACGESMGKVADRLYEDPWVPSGRIENVSVQKWDILLGSLQGP